MGRRERDGSIDGSRTRWPMREAARPAKQEARTALIHLSVLPFNSISPAYPSEDDKEGLWQSTPLRRSGSSQ